MSFPHSPGGNLGDGVPVGSRLPEDILTQLTVEADKSGAIAIHIAALPDGARSPVLSVIGN